MKKILGFFMLGMILLLTSCEPTTLGTKNTLVNIAESVSYTHLTLPTN